MYKIWQPMKYSTARNDEVLREALESDNYCLQLKKDGSSYILAKDSDGSVHLYGDKISKKTGEVIDKIDNVPHLKNFAENYFPKESQILVEICFGQTSKDVNTIMLALPQKAIDRQRDEKVRAFVFDILYWDSEPLYEKDFKERWEKAVEVISKLRLNSDASEWLFLIDTVYSDKTKQLSEWIFRGEEGGVLKMLTSTKKTSAAHHVRELGETVARPANTTFKVKQIDTVDVVIMEVQPPNREYSGKNPETYPYRDENDEPINRLYALGMANGFVIGGYDDNNELIKIGTVASGLDDILRKDALDNPENYIGKVIEVDCMSKDTENRTLRHPRLMGMRADKSAEQCLLREMF